MEASGLTIAIPLVCLIAGGAFNLASRRLGALILGAVPPWLAMLVIELIVDPMNRAQWPLPDYSAGFVAGSIALVLWARRRHLARPAPS